MKNSCSELPFRDETDSSIFGTTCRLTRRLRCRERRHPLGRWQSAHALAALLAVAAACLLSAQRGLGAAQTVATVSGSCGSAADQINTYDLFGQGLFWTEGRGVCSGEFCSHSKLNVFGYLGGWPSRVVEDCTVHFSGVARDDLYLYYGSNGRIYRKAVSAGAADPATELPAPPYTPTPAGREMGPLALLNGVLYWTDSNGSEFGVFSMNMDGTNPQLLMTGNGPKVTKMVAYTYSASFLNWVEALFMLNQTGTLLRYDVNPAGSFVVTLATAGVTDFAIRDESATAGSFITFFTTVYAATGQLYGLQQSTPPGQVLAINAVTGNTTIACTNGAQDQVTSIAADNLNLYFTVQPVDWDPLFGYLLGSPSIWRKSDASSYPHPDSAPVLIGTQTDAGQDLRSDGKWLYFLGGPANNPGADSAIKRLATDAPALQLDVQADALELVQAIQDMNGSVTLVANRPTFARGYAHLALNTTGKNTWFSTALLRGFRNEVELPGSPIVPVLGMVLPSSTVTLATLRSNLNQSFLFELPDSWVTPSVSPLDTLFLSMTVNPSQELPETTTDPLVNNTVTYAAPTPFTAKSRPCIVTVPLWCNSPPYYPGMTGFGGMMERARSLLPIDDFDIFPDLVPDPQGNDNEPFDLGNPDADTASDAQDDALDMLEDLDLASDPCEGRDGHYLGMVHPMVTGFNGVSWRNTPELIARMEWNPGRGVTYSGGLSTAHELGHDYGRQHVNCGTFPPDQANFDPSPYPCSLGNPDASLASATFGFDYMTRKIYPPGSAADIMSYSSPVWISAYNWDALAGLVPGASSFQFSLANSGLASKGTSSGVVLLVRGRVDEALQLAMLRSFYLLPEAAAPPSKVARSRMDSDLAGSVPDPYFIRLLDTSGATLSQVPVALRDGHVEGQPGSGKINFGQYIDFQTSARLLQLVHTSKVLAERFISPHSPVLLLGTPVVDPGAETLHLGWSASDPDGDPLRFIIQYSADNGANWRALQHDYTGLELTLSTQMLPGGSQCLLRVVASDGVNTALATTSPFSIAKHAPIPYINGVAEGQRFSAGTFLRLNGVGVDPESGSGNLVLSWNVVGPTPLTATGRVLSLTDFSPGPYTVSLTATDPDSQSGTVTRHFEVLPLMIPDGDTPELDGLANDSGYAGAAFVRVPLGGGDFAQVRRVHADGKLYVVFSNLKLGSASSPRSAGLRVDVNDSRDNIAVPGDIGFFVDENGIPRQEVGNGGGMVTSLTPTPGFSAAIHRGNTSWSAELSIADSLVGGWNHAAGITLAHDTVRWPAAATSGSPATWAAAYLGTNLPPLAARPPVADAGRGQSYSLRTARNLYLDGSTSAEPDGQPLTYAWTQLSGPLAALSDSSAAAPFFLAQPVTNRTTLQFQLAVGSSNGVSAPSSVQITLLPAPLRPPTPPPTGTATLRSDGQLQFRLVGQPRLLYRIVASADLQNWFTLRSVFADDSGRIDLTQAVDFNAYRALFYCAVSP